ncbi:MAG: GNAT family N-acetyltransferase [Bacteroidota bacterium]
MTYRPGNPGDFLHVETFVWQAIFPAYDHPDLNEAQRASNDAIVETARAECYQAMGTPGKQLFVAWDEKRRELAGFVIVDKSPLDYPELVWLIVSRRNWGTGVATELLRIGLEWLGDEKPIKLGVIHYNERAIAFYKKYGFIDTGETAGDHLIPRILMLREARPWREASAEDTPANVQEGAPAERTVTATETTKEVAADTPQRVDLFSELTNTVSETEQDNQPDEDAFVGRLDTAEITDQDESELELEASFEVRARPDEEDITNRRPDIEFEIDYGHRKVASVAQEGDTQEEVVGDDFTFEFAFTEAVPEEPAANQPPPQEKRQPEAEEAIPLTEKYDFLNEAPFPTDFNIDDSLTLDDLAAAYEEQEAPAAKQATSTREKDCIHCGVKLPLSAKFCFSCGGAQQLASPLGNREDNSQDSGNTPEDPGRSTQYSNASSGENRSGKSNDRENSKPAEQGESSKDQQKKPPPKKAESRAKVKDSATVMRELRQDLAARFDHFVVSTFGERKRPAYDELWQISPFQRVVDAALENLHRWAMGRDLDLAVNRAAWPQKKNMVMEDLIEYFIVEEGKSHHGGIFPQRLLRYQSCQWNKVDRFQLMNSYLDFEEESETVYTDFISMSARKLKNATRSFLYAGHDERIFFIVDQSLMGSLKNGFALTDKGLYWKNVLQPNHVVYFSELTTVVVQHDHLLINDHFFDAGKRLNYKVAMLLRKLSRLNGAILVK